MLQAIINGQSAMKEELLSEIRKVDKKVEQVKENLSKEIRDVEVRLSARIDKIGTQVAQLDDDAPTGEEFKELEKRVGDLEQKIAS